MRSSQGKKNLIYGVIILLVIGSIWMVISPDFKSHLNKQGATSRAEYPSVDENRAGPSQSSPVTGSPGATSKVIQNQNVQGAQSSPVVPVVPVQGQATRPVSASRVGTPAGAVQNGVTQGVGAPVGAVQGVATLLGGPQALVKVGASVPAVATKSEAAPVTDGCFTVSYSPKKSAGLDHERQKNLLTLLESGSQNSVNPKSVCVLVNGAAVKHTFVPGKANQIIIGSIAGADSKITARYCLGKSTCAEKCEVKKDQFMSALGMDDSGSESGDAPAVGWDGSSVAAKEDVELETEVAALNVEQGGSQGGIFSAWVAETHALACARRSL